MKQRDEDQHTIMAAIAKGLTHAASVGLSKPRDQALCAVLALDNAGFHVVRKPKAAMPAVDSTSEKA